MYAPHYAQRNLRPPRIQLCICRFEKYFSKQKWYKPVKSNSEVKLSEVEQYNVDIIKMIEK
ncbi:MAG: YARHG domain-containing protein [Bacteroidales bacterium]|nr:YARHG domain-containing protein [Bacteroidales bacterium]